MFNLNSYQKLYEGDKMVDIFKDIFCKDEKLNEVLDEITELTKKNQKLDLELAQLKKENKEIFSHLGENNE